MKHTTLIFALVALVACNAPQQNRNLKAMEANQFERNLLLKKMERTTDPKELAVIGKHLDSLTAQFDSLTKEQARTQ